MVRSQLEYASIVWDPIYINDVHNLKIFKVEQQDELKDFSRYSSVTSCSNISSGLNFKLHKISRLQTFYKALHNQIPLSILTNHLPMTRDTRHYHQHPFILPTTSTTAYQKSYFSRTAQDWNSLPKFIINLNDFDSFSVNVSNYCNNVHV